MSSENRVSISVVVPTLNEERILSKTLQAIRALEKIDEVIVSDGASSDATAAIGREHKCRVVMGTRGRGSQLAAGATVARGTILWFVHADTQPPADAVHHIASALSDCTVVGGHFRVRFDGREASAHLFTVIYRCAQWFGLCYGDSAYFVRREAYNSVGGFHPLPLFEDLDLRRRLRRRGRFVCVPATVTTSARRFEKRSATLMFLRWASLQVLYWVGMPPRLIAKFYAAVRGSECPMDVRGTDPNRSRHVQASDSVSRRLHIFRPLIAVRGLLHRCFVDRTLY